jgi:hypothetical protein
MIASTNAKELANDPIVDELRTPLLFVDVNLGGDAQERIVVYENETAPVLAKQFCDLHNLDEETQGKLEELLDH